MWVSGNTSHFTPSVRSPPSRVFAKGKTATDWICLCWFLYSVSVCFHSTLEVRKVRRDTAVKDLVPVVMFEKCSADALQ